MQFTHFINPQVNSKYPKNNLLLIELLKRMKPGDVFERDKMFSIIFQGEFYNICLTREILCRKRQGKSGLRYEVINNTPKGQGSFGEVFLTTTLIIHDDHIERKYKRIIKREKKRTEVNAFEQEAVIGQKISYLHMKPVVDNNQTNERVVCEKFLIMRHLSGEPLKDLLIIGKISRLDPFEKLKLSLALLRVFKRELYDKGVIHNDIKPDNIMVDLNQETQCRMFVLLTLVYLKQNQVSLEGITYILVRPNQLVETVEKRVTLSL